MQMLNLMLQTCILGVDLGGDLIQKNGIFSTNFNNQDFTSNYKETMHISKAHVLRNTKKYILCLQS